MQIDMFPQQLKRPTRSDPKIIEEAAAEYAVKMARKWPEYSEQEWQEALVENYCEWKDGYKLAKDFESDGFDPDPDMVEELDDFHFKVSETCRKAEKHWVAMCGFTPEFEIGERVDMGENSRRERYGFVSGIRHESAEYEVKIDMNSNSAYIIKSENLHKIVD